MNSVQESKQELQAAIRYAENAISSAQATIESMEFRQEMAKKQRSEQKGREENLESALDDANSIISGLVKREKELKAEAARLKSENIRLKASIDAAAEHIKDMREDLNDQIKLDEEVRQGVNDFLDFLDTIGYERA